MYLIVANGEPPSPDMLSSLAKASKGLIAVDGGLIACDRASVKPDLIIGDFDSAPPKLLKKYQHIPQMLTTDQNKNDLEKAIEYLFNLSFGLSSSDSENFNFPIESLTVCGALGKRIDHTLANLCLLCRFPGKIRFATEEGICFAIHKSCELTCCVGQTLSLIPMSSQVTGVSTYGLKWELNQATLDKNFISVSNMCSQENIRITVDEGDLLLFITKEV